MKCEVNIKRKTRFGVGLLVLAGWVLLQGNFGIPLIDFNLANACCAWDLLTLQLKIFEKFIWRD